MSRIAKGMVLTIATLWLAAATSAVAADAETPRPAASTLSRAKSASLPVDARGFIHRWLVLEPVPVPGRPP